MDDSRTNGDRRFPRRDFLAVLGAASLASVAGCNELRPSGDRGSTGGSQVTERQSQLDFEGDGMVYVRQRSSELPAPDSTPAIGITSQGTYIHDGQAWRGPVGVGTENQPASGSHFEAITVQGAVRAEQQILDGDVFDIRAYGAAVDGETDDLTAIEDALAQARETNGTVLIPPGTTRIDGRIEIGPEHSGVTICGTGYDSRLVVTNRQGNANGGLRISAPRGKTVENVTIENLRLDGGEKARGTGLEVVVNGGTLGDIRIGDVWIHDWIEKGISIQSGGIVVRGVTVWNNQGSGLYIDNTAEVTNLVSDVIAWKNGRSGIELAGGRNILTNVLSQGNRWGVTVAGNGTETVLFANGSITESADQGFRMGGPVGVLMVDNVEARGNGATGFEFDREGMVLIGNVVTDGNGGDGNVVVGKSTIYANTVVVQRARGVGLRVEGVAHIGRILTSDNGDADVEIGRGGLVYVDYSDARAVSGGGTLVERGVASVSLRGRGPDARQYATGVFVHDTDTPNRVYLVHDATERNGHVRLS